MLVSKVFLSELGNNVQPTPAGPRGIHRPDRCLCLILAKTSNFPPAIPKLNPINAEWWVLTEKRSTGILPNRYRLSLLASRHDKHGNNS